MVVKHIKGCNTTNVAVAGVVYLLLLLFLLWRACILTTAAGVLALALVPAVAGLYPYYCWHGVPASAGIPSVAGNSAITSALLFLLPLIFLMFIASLLLTLAFLPLCQKITLISEFKILKMKNILFGSKSLTVCEKKK